MHAGMFDQRDSLGFSLVELLVAVGIIGSLLAIVLPAVQSARSAARRVQCQNNLRQLAISAHAFHGARGHFPAGFAQRRFPAPPIYRGTSLFAQLLPFVENANLLEGWDYADPILNATGGENARTAQVVELLLCPDDILPANPVARGQWSYALTSYGGNGGTRSLDPQDATVDGVFHSTGPASEPRADQRPVSAGDIRDGTSHTLLFGERSHDDSAYESFAAAGWTEPLDSWGWWGPCGGRRSIGHVTLSSEAPLNYRLPFDFAERESASGAADTAADFQTFTRLRLSAYGSNHVGGASCAFADGSIRFISDDVATATFRAMTTREGDAGGTAQ
jgi:prepilin-type N-terminal cleavage/methylation domain-containing protein